MPRHCIAGADYTMFQLHAFVTIDLVRVYGWVYDDSTAMVQIAETVGGGLKGWFNDVRNRVLDLLLNRLA